MWEALKKFLVEKHGLKASATDEEAQAKAVELMRAGTLEATRYAELITVKQVSADPMERLGSIIGSAVQAAVKPLNDRLSDMEAKGVANGMEVAVQAGAQLIGAAGNDGATSLGEKLYGQAGEAQGKGGVRVKAASEGYSGTKATVLWGTGHKMAGHPVVFEGRVQEHASERERAMIGAYLKRKMAIDLKMGHMVRQHDLDLSEECIRTMKFSGFAEDNNSPSGEIVYQNEFLRPEHQKTIFADSTSGGTNYIQQVLEDEIIRNALLFGELFPYVNVKPFAKGTSVDTPVLVNMTISSGTNETVAISAQSTTSLLSKLNSPMFAAVGAVTIGRDFLLDSAPDIMSAINESYSDQLKAWLDEQIAIGDGTTEPLGVFTASGTTSVPNASPSPTGWDVVDVENLVKGIGKQYRANKSPSVRFLSNDTSYFRVRALQVSTTDQRRIFGMTHEDYMVLNRPWSVNAQITNAKVCFGDFSKYRLWRRLGIEMRTTDQGQTLSLANAVLVTLRSRWAGRPLIGEAFAVMTNALA